VDDDNTTLLERPEVADQQHPSPTAPRATVAAAAANFRSKSTRKRSVHLSLVLISAAALGGVAGCSNIENGDNLNRDVYANIEECKADWGTPGDCEEIESTRSATGARSYYGPRYYSRSGSVGSTGYTTNSRPGSRAKGTVSSAPSRGGFGASSSRHSGGSSHSSGG
jgi:uncharacterized protein YgiB involved in biofilm formation